MSRLFLPGAGADPSRSEPESAPGPWPSGAGAAQKSGGSATLHPNMSKKYCIQLGLWEHEPHAELEILLLLFVVKKIQHDKDKNVPI